MFLALLMVLIASALSSPECLNLMSASRADTSASEKCFRYPSPCLASCVEHRNVPFAQLRRLTTNGIALRISAILSP
jgi:hypothetical protein